MRARCGLFTLQQHVISAGSPLVYEVPPGSGTNAGVGRTLQAFLDRSVSRPSWTLPSATSRREVRTCSLWHCVAPEARKLGLWWVDRCHSAGFCFKMEPPGAG